MAIYGFQKNYRLIITKSKVKLIFKSSEKFSPLWLFVLIELAFQISRVRKTERLVILLIAYPAEPCGPRGSDLTIHQFHAFWGLT